VYVRPVEVDAAAVADELRDATVAAAKAAATTKTTSPVMRRGSLLASFRAAPPVTPRSPANHHQDQVSGQANRIAEGRNRDSPARSARLVSEQRDDDEYGDQQRLELQETAPADREAAEALSGSGHRLSSPPRD
jgi:hypothetical protein